MFVEERGSHLGFGCCAWTSPECCCERCEGVMLVKTERVYALLNAHEVHMSHVFALLNALLNAHCMNALLNEI